jgi:hypothetical protein
VTWNNLTANYLNWNFSKFLGRFSELKCGVTMWLFYSILQMTFLCVLCVIYRTSQWSTDCTVFVGLEVMVLTPLSTIFQLYRGGQFYLWLKPEYPNKTVDLPQVTNKLSHNVVSNTPRPSGIWTHNLTSDWISKFIGDMATRWCMIL